MSGGVASALSEACARTSRLINDSYPADTPYEVRVHRRISMKLAEELGEVTTALGGWLGENPRKGVTHTLENVLEELLDVAACALGAYEFLTDHEGRSVADLHVLVLRKQEQLAAAIRTAVEDVVNAAEMAETVKAAKPKVVDLMAALEESLAAAKAKKTQDAPKPENYEAAVRFTVNAGWYSMSAAQRALRIGFGEASRIEQALINNGVIDPTMPRPYPVIRKGAQ